MDSKLITSGGYCLLNFRVAESVGINESILLGYLISKQQYFEKKGMLEEDGYFYLLREDIAKSTKVSYKKQKEAFDNLERLGFILTKITGIPAKKHFIVLEYKIKEFFDTYQEPNVDYDDISSSDDMNPASKVEIDSPSKVEIDLTSSDEIDLVNNNRYTTNGDTTIRDTTMCVGHTQEEVESEKKKNLNNITDSVIDYMNEVGGKRFKKIETNREFIRARLNDGYTIEDCKEAIDKSWEKDHGTDKEMYFNPKTIFRPKNFEMILNMPWKRKSGQEMISHSTWNGTYVSDEEF